MRHRNVCIFNMSVSVYMYMGMYIGCMCYDVRMCAHDHICIHSPMSIHVEASSHHEVLSSATLCLILWDKIAHWTESLPVWKVWQPNKGPRSACLSALVLWLHMQATIFYVGDRNPNLGPWVYVTSLWPTKLSPQFPLPPFSSSDEE